MKMVDLQFIKITERIFAILFQSGSDVIYRNNIKFICERLKKIYFDKYKIFNFSQKRSDLGRANQQGIVLEFGWPEPLSPPLDRLCSICKQLENHLNNSKENIAIIHCKGGIYRAGIVISAFMNYTNICSSEENLPDRFSMKLFTEKYMEINTQPSHKRYVNYFINLLNGTTKVYPTPIYLKYISLYKLFSGQTVKLKLYERMKPIWSSGKIILKENTLIEISENNNNKSLRKSASPRSYQHLNNINNNNIGNSCGGGGGDFSRADSYENFEKAEDERSLSVPIGINTREYLNENNFQKLNDEINRIENGIEETNLNNKSKLSATDGADSGIGSDSPKVLSNQLNLPNQYKEKQKVLEEINEQKSDSKLNLINMPFSPPPPPPVPPKSSLHKHSSDKKEEESDQQILIQNYNLNEEKEEENDLMRSAFEDSTIGRDHSVLPPGARSSSRSRHSPHTTIDGGGGGGGTSTSSSDEKPRRRVIISPMVQPQLVASGRYDPNSRCFSYVPAKSLKEHYKAPKKPSLKRRTSVIEPADLELSPLEAKMALENFGLQSSSSETNRKPEIPKWEAEIDKLTGEKVESHHRPRRASTTGTPVGHIQRDYIRSPSATQTKRSPQDDWNYYNKQNKIQEKTLNWPTITSNNYQKSNENILTTLSDKWPNLTTQRLSRSQIPSRDNYYQMTTSMPSSTIQTPSTEQPLVIFEQAKRATPTLLQQKIYSNSYSPSIGNRRRPIPGVRPSPRRNEMDTLCDPEFYLSYSSLPQNKQNEKEFLSKSVPNKNEFNQMALKELQRDDVKELLAQHIPNNNNNKGNNYFNSSIRRSQTPQNPLITCKELRKPLIDEYRTRNCRSVNSTPLIGNKRLFLYKEFDEPLTDPESAEDWLHSKLETLKGRKHLKEEPFARNKYEAEKLLLEELKNKATKLISEKNIKENEGGDPLEEYKKEEQRLKNTKLPFLTLDGLRKANKYLQNERAKQNIFGQQNSSSSSFKNFSSDLIIQQQRSLSSIPINNNNSIINSSSSSIPYNTNKRGATPTGQIMIEKPPTPPPLIKGIENRERSKSPHNSKIFLNNSSTSLKKSSFDEIEEPLQSTSSLSAVNPNLLALRQSLYEKERQRMGLSYNNELIDSKLNKWPLPELIKENNQNSSSNNKYSTSVKPILKRNTLQKNNTNGNESPTIFNNKQNCNNNNNNNEKNLSQQQKELLNNWIIDRSDTPQFPLISDRETPLPYHPLLYKNEDYNQKLTKNNLINQSVLINRTDSLTPHSMYGNGSSGNGFGRRSSLNSIEKEEEKIIKINNINNNNNYLIEKNKKLAEIELNKMVEELKVLQQIEEEEEENKKEIIINNNNKNKK
ncbi:hypothetical protein Mgra_00006719 [Meloidogyne graminicola]|uniref:Phosphatase tensin-type domain-containing protein n=1 Tax=Meloidogyne graminicola TaxID=189291 RepID=A0A8S9ZKN8_9BILA|nr:hypothetical protein Mgra_00006719 [Meloidogyne graminicola]